MKLQTANKNIEKILYMYIGNWLWLEIIFTNTYMKTFAKLFFFIILLMYIVHTSTMEIQIIGHVAQRIYFYAIIIYIYKRDVWM